MFQISEQGYAFVAQREACSLTAYHDRNHLAIGFGYNKPGLNEGDVTTFDAAKKEFVEVSKNYEKSINIIFTDDNLLQNHVNACYSLMWNLGATDFRKDIALVDTIKKYCNNTSLDPNIYRPLRDKAGYRFVIAHPANWDFITNGPFNLARRNRESLIFTNSDYGDITNLMFWDAGKNPKAINGKPADPAKIIPMPLFLS